MKEKLKLKIDFLKQITYDTWIALVATGFLGASLWTTLIGSDTGVTFMEQSFSDGASLPFFILRMIFGIFIIFELMILSESIYPIYAGLFTITLLWASELSYIVYKEIYVTNVQSDISFLVGIGIVVIIVTKYLTAGDKLGLEKISKTELFSSKKNVYRMVWCAIALFVLVVSYVAIYRYKTFTSTTYDFGIFAQMFQQMKKTGLPYTTVERGELTSHFSVHFSPSWYILLPGYMIFSSPIYLYIANAFIIALGALPVFRIAEKLGESHFNSFIFAVIYLLFPSMSAGTLWDIHENSMLPVFILYMICFYMEEKTAFMYIFAALTLLTKEDAAIYVIAFGLFCIFAAKKKKHGLILVIISIAYFIFATKMVIAMGGEVMTSRLSNYYTSDSDGLSGVIKTCIINAGYMLYESISADSGKLTFILWMLVPVLFAPFLSKRNSMLILLMPMLVVNLMSYWTYQANVYFQYTYGPAAMIIFASLVAFSGWRKRSKLFYIMTAVVMCLCMSRALFWSKGAKYIENYSDSRDYYETSQETIDEFLEEYYQEGDSVTAQSFLVPHLYEVDELYTLPAEYSEPQYTDWYILNEQYQNEDEYPTDILEQYECVNSGDGGMVRIYRKQE